MPNNRFPGFFQFCMEKKEIVVGMKTLYDFSYFLMHIRPFDEISNYNKGIYMIKFDKKTLKSTKVETKVET